MKVVLAGTSGVNVTAAAGFVRFHVLFMYVAQSEQWAGRRRNCGVGTKKSLNLDQQDRGTGSVWPQRVISDGTSSRLPARRRCGTFRARPAGAAAAAVAPPGHPSAGLQLWQRAASARACRQRAVG